MPAARILVACDKFKGSLTAPQVRDAVAAGVRQATPTAEVCAVLVSDGGDGLLDVAVAGGFTRVPVLASGPTGERVESAYAVRPTPRNNRGNPEQPRHQREDHRGNNRGNPEQPREVVVELADVCGLLRLPGGAPAPLTATSTGLGEVIAAAVHREQPGRLVVGIGGSASTDGGAGLVRALGARLLDARGRPIADGAVGLETIAAVDLSSLILGHGRFQSRGRGPDLTVACDVAAPLTGPHGAAHVFAPQKGATPAQVERLDAALTHWADVVAATVGHDLRDVPGAGAAGGVGFAAVALLGATLRRGVDLALDLVGFDRALDGVDLVITGEGSFDQQSLLGKAPLGVAQRASAHGIPVLALCGRRDVTDAQARTAGFHAVHALSDLEPDPATSMAHAGPLLTTLTAAAVTRWLEARGGVS